MGRNAADFLASEASQKQTCFWVLMTLWINHTGTASHPIRISEGFCFFLTEACLSLRDNAGCRECFSSTLYLPAQGHRCSHSLAADGLPPASALCFMRLGLPLISFPFYLSSSHPARNVSQGCVDCLLNALNSCCCQKNILSLLLFSILLASLILSRDSLLFRHVLFSSGLGHHTKHSQKLP